MPYWLKSAIAGSFIIIIAYSFFYNKEYDRLRQIKLAHPEANQTIEVSVASICFSSAIITPLIIIFFIVLGIASDIVKIGSFKNWYLSRPYINKSKLLGLLIGFFGATILIFSGNILDEGSHFNCPGIAESRPCGFFESTFSILNLIFYSASGVAGFIIGNVAGHIKSKLKKVS